MYYVLSSRENLLPYFPKDGVGAEIGVAQGDYSEAILAAAQPSELHLIDPWSHLEDGSGLLAADQLLAEVESARAHGAAFAAPPPIRRATAVRRRGAAFRGRPAGAAPPPV